MSMRFAFGIVLICSSGVVGCSGDNVPDVEDAALAEKPHDVKQSDNFVHHKFPAGVYLNDAGDLVNDAGDLVYVTDAGDVVEIVTDASTEDAFVAAESDAGVTADHDSGIDPFIGRHVLTVTPKSVGDLQCFSYLGIQGTWFITQDVAGYHVNVESPIPNYPFKGSFDIEPTPGYTDRFTDLSGVTTGAQFWVPAGNTNIYCVNNCTFVAAQTGLCMTNVGATKTISYSKF